MLEKNVPYANAKKRNRYFQEGFLETERMVMQIEGWAVIIR